LKKLRWSLAAAGDLEEIDRYLNLNHPVFALETVRRIYSSARSLKQFPEKGRPGKITGTRELVLTPLPYVIVYSVESERVHLLRIFHGAQDRL
jgi:toxin ParE1/3/4